MQRKRLFLSPPHQTGSELRFLSEAVASNYLAPLGPMVDGFEAELAAFTGFSDVLAVTSGTAAIHLALRLLDTGPGDVVVSSTLTFIGGVAPVLYQGATPIFVDSSPDDWLMDPELLRGVLENLSRRGRTPKAVIVTELFGQPARVDLYRAICDPHGVPLIIDAAESLGSKRNGCHGGKGALLVCLSFNGNKIITTSGGGALLADDPALIARARYLSQQARAPVPYYEHNEIGYNYRMSNLVAAVGRAQMTRIEERVERRREIFAFYRQALGDLAGVWFMPEPDGARGNRWLSIVLFERDVCGLGPSEICASLEAESIEARRIWKPMHLQPVFRDAERAEGGVAESLFERGVCLPSGTANTAEDLERVVAAVRDAVARARTLAAE